MMSEEMLKQIEKIVIQQQAISSSVLEQNTLLIETLIDTAQENKEFKEKARKDNRINLCLCLGALVLTLSSFFICYFCSDYEYTTNTNTLNSSYTENVSVNREEQVKIIGGNE